MIDISVTLNNLLHDTATAINPHSLITHLLVKIHAIPNNILNDLPPMHLPVRELFSLFGHHFERSAVPVEIAFQLVPGPAELKERVDDLLYVLVMLD